MARGSTIVLTAEPRGNRLEGTISGTSLPGTIMMVKPGATLISGRPTWQESNQTSSLQLNLRGVLTEDSLQGFTVDTAYVTARRCFLYCPLPGDELNVRCGRSGGVNNWTIGDELMIDSITGVLVPQTGTNPITAIVMDTLTGVADNYLVWVMFTGM